MLEWRTKRFFFFFFAAAQHLISPVWELIMWCQEKTWALYFYSVPVVHKIMEEKQIKEHTWHLSTLSKPNASFHVHSWNPSLNQCKVAKKLTQLTFFLPLSPFHWTTKKKNFLSLFAHLALQPCKFKARCLHSYLEPKAPPKLYGGAEFFFHFLKSVLHYKILKKHTSKCALITDHWGGGTKTWTSTCV